MPRIPDFAPTVAPSAAPTPQQSIAAPGEAFGTSIAGAGRDLAQGLALAAQHAERFQARENETAAKEADLLASKALDDLQYHPETGYQAKQGRNAMDGYTGALEAAGKIQAEALEGITNPEVKRLAGPVIANRVQSAIAAMSRHAAVENRKWQVEVSASRVEATSLAAGHDYTNDQQFSLALNVARDEARAQGELLGLSPELVAIKAQGYIDKAWADRLDSWRLHDPIGAFGAFTKGAEEISPQVRAKMAQTLFAHYAPARAALFNEQGGVIALPERAKPGDPLEPRGIRNNNPGNIVKSEEAWEGKVAGLDSRYEAFATPQHGLRALAKNLMAYQANHGLSTIEEVVARWAPATENNTSSYIAAVSKSMGVESGAALDLTNRTTLVKLSRAIVDVENGKGAKAVTDAQISAGVDAALGTQPLPIAAQSAPSTPTAPGAFVNMTPAEASRLKTGDPVFDALPADWKMQVVHLAQTQARQDNSQQRAELGNRYRDAAATFAAGKDFPNAPTTAELVFTYGQAEGAAKARELAGYQQLGQDVSRLAGMPPSQQAALIASRAPVAGEGFADAQQRQQQLMAAADRVAKARAADPARFVLENAEPVNAAYRALAGTMGDKTATPAVRAAAAQAYATATLAEQQRLEISDPKVLPQPMVDAIAQRFNAPPEDGQNMGSVVRGVVEQWGRFWPMVGKQLSKSIPPAAVVIGLGIKPEAEQVLSEAISLKPEVRQQGIPPAELTDIKDQVRAQFEPLQRTLVLQSGGTETYDNFADSATAMAELLVQRGMKPKEAAAKAFESMAGFKYEFESTWRVPKDVLGGSTTTQALRDGSRAVMRDISETKDFTVPSAPGAVRAEDGMRQWQETVRANGFWVTSPGDGGLTLYVRSGLGALPVLNAQGEPVRRPWGELATVGNSVRAAFAGDVYKKGVRMP